MGGHVYATDQAIGIVSATVSGSGLPALAQRSDIAHLSIDAVITGQVSSITPDSALTGGEIFEPAASDPLVQVVERAVAAGIVVVVSAGNAGKDLAGNVAHAGIMSPGNSPSAVTVGALDINDSTIRGDDSVPAYSSRGPTWYDAFAKPDIVAPGRHLMATGALDSTLYAQHPELRVNALSGQLNRNGNYLRLSGTSVAAAVTSGVVALVLEANRTTHRGSSIAPNAVKAILEFTSFDMGLDVLTQGAGALDASGAVRLAEAIDPRAAVGERWVLKDYGPPWEVVTGQIVNWSQQLIWGDRLVWGDTIQTAEPAWGQRIVWGDLSTVSNMNLSTSAVSSED